MRRRKRRTRVVVSLVFLAVAIAGGWWLWPRGEAERRARVNGTTPGAQPTDVDELSLAPVPEAVIAAGTSTTTPTDETLTSEGTRGGTAPGADSAGDREGSGDEPRLAQVSKTENDAPAAPEQSRNPRIDASLRRYQAGQVIAARQELNRMLAISRNPAERAELRRHLEKIAAATILSSERRADDPLTATYTIQPGDVLINIGKQFDVPHEIIMMINGISDATGIRPGRRIKVPRGPFHAKIHKSQFRLEVYLQDFFVRSFPVGLGVAQATPEGLWRVKERLTNPAYYPPASASDKRIIAPDDPENPLGERWIGLEGIGGGAVGRFGYGIHGTIEPDGVGKAVSLGCIRMLNEDVAFLYRVVLPGRSTVTILP